VKRVLITGASGFIGRHCLDALVASDYEIHAVARRPLADTRNIVWHPIDLLMPGAASELARRVRASHLLHFAWYTKHALYWTAPENSKWLACSIELVGAFADAGGERAVCAGTCAEYAWNNSVCDECSTALAPSTPYSRAKVALYSRLTEMARDRHFTLGWGRVFFPYGPFEAAQRLVPTVINSILRREPVKCTSGEQQLDYLYVQDVADAFVALLGSDVTGAVNVASGTPVRVCDVVKRLAYQLGGLELVRFGALPTRQSDPKLLVAAVERLGTEVGWRPTLAVDKALTRTIEWWRSVARIEPAAEALP
jgi:nucleoside-diphosphate-sugar epimerase